MGDGRGAAAGSALVNTSIVGFLKLFHVSPLQPELAATVHTVPFSTSHGAETLGVTKLFSRTVLPTVLELQEICLLDYSADGLSPPQGPPD